MSARRVIDAIGANMALRVGSFAMSMLLTRLSTPESRGMSFQADVVVNTAGFIAREALRCLYSTYPHAIQAQRLGKGSQAQPPLGQTRAMAGLLAMGAMALPLALMALVLLEVVGCLLPVPSVSRLAFVAESPPSMVPVWCWLAGLAVEWSCEPLVAIVTATHTFKARVVAEALALAASKGAAVAALSVLGPVMAAYPSYLVGLQQLVYGLVTAAVLCWYVFGSSNGVPAREKQAGKDSTDGAHDEELTLFEAKELSLAAFAHYKGEGAGAIARLAAEEARARIAAWGSYFSETVLRLVLTEGEKYILASYVTMSGQGVFDVVNTLGSLVARMIFRVWEDGSFNVWRGRISAADEKHKSESTGTADKKPSSGVDTLLLKSTTAPYYVACLERECLPMLQGLVRICLYVGCLTMLLVQPLPRFALSLIFSSRWASDEATTVLRLFCLYIPLMGVNGLLEAFIRATARRHVFARMQQLMVGTSVASIAVTLFFVRFMAMGVAGLMVASLVNTSLRTAINLYLMGSYVPGAVVRILQPRAFAPLVGLVAAVNVALLVAFGGANVEVGPTVGLRSLGTAAVLGVAAIALVAPIAYTIEKKSGNSLLLRGR